MDLIVDLMRWFEALTTAVGDPASVVVVPGPVVTPAPVDEGGSLSNLAGPLVAAVVGLGVIVNSQRIQRNTLSHDREMRVKDDAREALAAALVAAEKAERAALAIREAAEPLRAYFRTRAAPLATAAEREAAAGEAADELLAQGALMQLYFRPEDDVYVAYRSATTTMRPLGPTRLHDPFSATSAAIRALTSHRVGATSSVFEGLAARSALGAIAAFRVAAREYSLQAPVAPLRWWQFWRKEWRKRPVLRWQERTGSKLAEDADSVRADEQIEDAAEPKDESAEVTSDTSVPDPEKPDDPQQPSRQDEPMPGPEPEEGR